jgi:hypothetical protein
MNLNPDWAKVTVEVGKTYTASVVHTVPYMGGYDDNWSASIGVYTNADLTTPIDFKHETPPGAAVPTTITCTAAYSGIYYILYSGRAHYRIQVREVYTLAVSSAVPANLIKNGDFSQGGIYWTYK